MVFGLWSHPAGKSKEVLSEPKGEGKPPTVSQVSSTTDSDSTSEAATDATPAEVPPQSEAAPVSSLDVPASDTQEPPIAHSAPSSAPATSVVSSAPVSVNQEPPARPRAQQRFSWRSLVHPKGVQNRKAAPPTLHEQAEKEAVARREFAEQRILRARSEKRAHKSALVVRDLIVGPFAAPSAAPPRSSKIAAAAVPSRKRMQKVEAQLLQPKSAKKVIAELRQLPSSDVPVVVGKTPSGEDVRVHPCGPIHAVCLPYTDAEAEEKRFAKLDKVEIVAPLSKASPKTRDRSLDITAIPSRAVGSIASVTTSSFDKLKELVSDLDVISLVSAPDLGFGQPAGAPGLLSGAVPTAKTVIQGVEQITPQLMALGYATGKSLLPSHAGVYPPTDRISVITYWWGLEVVIPEPSVKYLSNVPSIAHTIVNFLTALSVANGGVREILPFVRYISQYIDAQFNSIRDQDQGKGVVCAATWIMPAALVPRPWDFPDPPGESQPDGESPTPAAPAEATHPNLGPIMLTPPLPGPNHAPVFTTTSATPATQRESAPTKDEDDVPGVTVTPPTPPASETLGKSAGGPFSVKAVDPEEAADMVDENGLAAFGEAVAHHGVVNGVPVAVVA